MSSRKRGNRRLSRELALRALYQWRIAGAAVDTLLADVQAADEYPEANADFLAALLTGVLGQIDTLDDSLARFLDRPVGQLSPIEHGILLIGAFELLNSLDVPYRVVISEAVDLAKRYGGTDGHKYVNGVLDRLAREVRRVEIAGSGA